MNSRYVSLYDIIPCIGSFHDVHCDALQWKIIWLIISSAEGFRPVANYTRACFSSDGRYVACGSHNSQIYLWNVHDSHGDEAKLEATLSTSNKWV